MTQGRSRDMTEGPILRHIVVFMLPLLVGGVFQQLYNVTDTLIVGNTIGSQALAAIGATGATTHFMLSLAMGLTNAFAIVMAQNFGSKDLVRVRLALTNSVLIVFAAGVLLSLLGLFGARPLMRLMQTPGDIIDGAVIYIQICIGGCFAQLAYNLAAAALRSIGDSRTPLLFLIMSSVINVALDLFFVLALHMGVAGVALATVISQAAAAALCIRYIFRNHPMLCFAPGDLRPDRRTIAALLRLGLPMSLQSVLVSTGDMILTGIINTFGTNVVAAYTVGSRVQSFVILAFSNTAHSFSTFVGQNFGAKRVDRVRDGFRKAVLITVALCLLSAGIAFFAGDAIVRWFISESDPQIDIVVPIARDFLRVTSVFYPFLGLIWLYNSTLRGLGEVIVPMASSMTELVVKIATSVLLGSLVGYIGVWFTGPAAWFFGLLPSAFIYHRGRWAKRVEAGGAPPG